MKSTTVSLLRKKEDIMATKTFEELKQLAIQIRDEKTNKQNTATRIGTQMLEHLNKLEQDYYDKTVTDEELKQRDEKLTELSSLSCIAPLLDMYIDYTKKQIKISTGCRIISPNGKLIVGGSHYLSQKGATIDISSILDAGILAYSSIFLLVKTENSEESPAAIAIGQTGNGTNASSLYLSEKIKEGYYVLAVFRNEKNEYCKVNAQYYYVDGVKIYNTVSETFKNKTYEILVIGNSYSYFGSRFLPRVADSLGIDANITLIGNSGQNFQYNLTKAKEDGLCNYYGYTTSDKVVINQQNQNGIKTIKEVLQSKRYDYIVLHQASASASDYSTYQPYLHDFISWIKENMLVEYTEFLLQQTWTYGISNYDDREAQRNKMDDIVSAYKQAAVAENIRVIPAGIAVQNAKETELGKYNDLMIADNIHLAQIGSLITSIAWAIKLFGRKYSVCVNDYVYSNFMTDYEYTESDIESAKKCASLALRFPEQISPLVRSVYNYSK